MALKVNERGYIYKLNETVRILSRVAVYFDFIVYFAGEQYKFPLLHGKILDIRFTIVQFYPNKLFSSEIK